MPSERSNVLTFVVGRKGSGKTTWARRRLLEFPRRIIIDPMWEYREGVVVRTVADLAEYVRPLRYHRYSVVLRGSNEDGLAVCEILTAGEPTNPTLPGALLVMDELDRYCSPHYLPDGLQAVINYGRHYSVSFIGISRRPKRVHRDVTANVDEIICYQTQEPGDVKYLAEFIGEDVAAKLPGLPPYEFLTYDAEGRVSVPEPREGEHAPDLRVTESREGDPAPARPVPDPLTATGERVRVAP